MGCYANGIGQCLNGVGKVSGASVQIHHIRNLVKNLYTIKGLGATGRTGLKKAYIQVVAIATTHPGGGSVRSTMMCSIR
jgi:hypothetical protein